MHSKNIAKEKSYQLHFQVFAIPTKCAKLAYIVGRNFILTLSNHWKIENINAYLHKQIEMNIADHKHLK